MKKPLLLLIDSLFVTRPILLIPVWGYFILGYYRASLLYGDPGLQTFTLLGHPYSWLSSFGQHGAWLALIMCSLSVCGTYVLNQLTDIEADKNNSGLPLIAKAGFPIKVAVVENILLCALPLFYAFYQSKALLILFLGAFAMTVLYNVRPFRFTGRPFLDFLSNAFAYGVLTFGLGWVVAAGGSVRNLAAFAIQAAPYFFYMVAGSINSTLPDEAGDRATEKITTVVLLGAKRANLISTGAITIALFFSVWNRDIIASLTGLISIPFFIRYARTHAMADGLKTFQLCGGLLMVLTIFVFPWCLAMGLITYGATRLYFKLRHNIDYPKAGA
ncbi:MAG: hypothetical protein A2293_10770 [Elusimicrobia bacterium RIFOXYB2_FULL_49_7]|nr:MAG: hypothetical protein A2293_10770 [Elusimicrobia bacterium RIFOXYB2_FULL_49_7]